MTIFTIWFQNFPNNLPILFGSVGVAVLVVWVFQEAATSADVEKVLAESLLPVKSS